MKIVINEVKLREYMAKNGVKNYKQLCRECGIDLNYFYCTKSRGNISKETYWLLANFFRCHVEDLQYADWTK